MANTFNALSQLSLSLCDAANLATQSGVFGAAEVTLNQPQTPWEQLCLSPDGPPASLQEHERVFPPSLIQPLQLHVIQLNGGHNYNP